MVRSMNPIVLYVAAIAALLACGVGALCLAEWRLAQASNRHRSR
jgi:hypothetical protein